MKKRTTKNDFHYDLHFADPALSFVLHVGSKKFPLQPHTEQTREQAKKSNKALALVPDQYITHYVRDVPVSQSAPQITFVKQDSPLAGQTLPPMVYATITLPTAAHEALLQSRVRTNHPDAAKHHPKLLAYGIEKTLIDDPQVIRDSQSLINATDTAIALVFQHNELLNNGSDTAASIINYIQHANNFSNLQWQIGNQVTAFSKKPSTTNNWVNQAPILDLSGNPIDGQYSYQWSPTTTEWTTPLIQEVLNKTKNDPNLQSSATNAGCYFVLDGITSAPVNSVSPSPVAIGAYASSNLSINNLTPQGGLAVTAGPSIVDSNFSMTLINNYVRWLGAYVEFFDANGIPVAPDNWVTPTDAEIYNIADTDTQKIATIVSSVNTIMGVPLGGDDFTISFPWPSNVASIKIRCGGLGRADGIENGSGVYYGGWDTDTCVLGTIMTVAFNMAMPALCLAAGAAIQFSQLKAIVSAAASVVASTVTLLINGGLSQLMQGQGLSTLMSAIGNFVLNLFLTNAAFKEAAAIEIGEAVAEDAVPVVGWIVYAINTAADAATLLETTIEVAKSPCVYEYEILDTINVSWELLPDAQHGNEWPLEATNYMVEAIYSNGTTRYLDTPGTLTSPQTGPITTSLSNIPGQVQVQFRASFYSESGWLAGVAQTDWMRAVANGDGGLLTLPATNITENQVPLSSATSYQYNTSLSYDSSTQSRSWSNVSGAPTATITNLNGTNAGNNIAALLNINNNASQGVLGYAYTAAGQNIPVEGSSTPTNADMSVFQGISSGQSPDDALCFVPFGCSAPTQFGIDPAAANPVSFYIDPAGFYIRPLTTGTPGTFDMNNGTSYGQFIGEVDDSIYHPAGYIVGISTQANAIQIVNISAGAVADADAPRANMYSGGGTRPGLLTAPLAVAAASDTAIIVLENYGTDPSTGLPIAGRLQAFDMYGNLANIFANAENTAALKTETGAVTLLDMAVESKGYIYVLKVVGDDNVPGNYVLDIYNPDGTFLSQTPGVTTGKITVDIWRTLYSLDYSTLAKTDDTRTEPGVSIWLPSVPGT